MGNLPETVKEPTSRRQYAQALRKLPSNSGDRG
jgi:hypothetical protein